jgi:hypothetical protein
METTGIEGSGLRTTRKPLLSVNCSIGVGGS